MAREPEGASPAIVGGHPFTPRLERGDQRYVEPPRMQRGASPYLCGYPDCGLAEAAHATAAEPFQITSERPPGRTGGARQTAVDS